MLRVVGGREETKGKEAENSSIFVDWVPGWTDGTWVKGARCSWLTMLGGCSLGIVSHLTLRAFKLMVRVNPCVFIHTGSIREEMYLS